MLKKNILQLILFLAPKWVNLPGLYGWAGLNQLTVGPAIQIHENKYFLKQRYVMLTSNRAILYKFCVAAACCVPTAQHCQQ